MSACCKQHNRLEMSGAKGTGKRFLPFQIGENGRWFPLTKVMKREVQSTDSSHRAQPMKPDVGV